MITMTDSQHTPRTPPVTIGTTVRRAVHRAAASLWHVHGEQTLMWELWWQANRATVPIGHLRPAVRPDAYPLPGKTARPQAEATSRPC